MLLKGETGFARPSCAPGARRSAPAVGHSRDRAGHEQYALVVRRLLERVRAHCDVVVLPRPDQRELDGGKPRDVPERGEERWAKASSSSIALSVRGERSEVGVRGQNTDGSSSCEAPLEASTFSLLSTRGRQDADLREVASQVPVVAVLLYLAIAIEPADRDSANAKRLVGRR
jgi:hypothetical protein